MRLNHLNPKNLAILRRLHFCHLSLYNLALVLLLVSLYHSFVGFTNHVLLKSGKLVCLRQTLSANQFFRDLGLRIVGLIETRLWIVLENLLKQFFPLLDDFRLFLRLWKSLPFLVLWLVELGV